MARPTLRDPPRVSRVTHMRRRVVLTLFADQAVVTVVRVVRVPQPSMGVLELEELVTMLSGVPCAVVDG